MFFLRPLVLNYTVYNYVDLVVYGTCCFAFFFDILEFVWLLPWPDLVSMGFSD